MAIKESNKKSLSQLLSFCKNNVAEDNAWAKKAKAAEKQGFLSAAKSKEFLDSLERSI